MRTTSRQHESVPVEPRRDDGSYMARTVPVMPPSTTGLGLGLDRPSGPTWGPRGTTSLGADDQGPVTSLPGCSTVGETRS